MNDQRKRYFPSHKCYKVGMTQGTLILRTWLFSKAHFPTISTWWVWSHSYSNSIAHFPTISAWWAWGHSYSNLILLNEDEVPTQHIFRWYGVSGLLGFTREYIMGNSPTFSKLLIGFLTFTIWDIFTFTFSHFGSKR